jgi:hypothetical protein
MLPLDGLAGIVIALAALAAAAALLSIWRSRAHSSKVRLIWTVLAVLLPFVGPLAWLLHGRVRRRVR